MWVSSSAPSIRRSLSGHGARPGLPRAPGSAWVRLALAGEDLMGGRLPWGPSQARSGLCSRGCLDVQDRPSHWGQ